MIQNFKLGELFEIQLGKTPARGNKKMWDQNKKSNNIWLSIKDLNQADADGYISDSAEYLSDNGAKLVKLIPENTLLLSFKLTLGRTAITKIPLRTNEAIAALIPKTDKCNIKYLKYYFEFFDFIKFASNDFKVKGLTLNKNKLANIPIPVPPLQEQEKIVERIQIATRSIDSKLKNIENQMFLVKNLFESYVNKTVHSNEIKGVLGDFITIQRGGSPRPIGKYLTNDKDGLNWIKISDATNSSKYIKETKQKITKDGLNKTREVKPGDFLLSNSMSFGRPYIMKISGCIHDGWLKLSEYEKYFDIDFLYYFLGSRDIFQKFNKSSRGSTVQNLNTSIVSSIEVGIPSLEKQRNISQKIMNFEKEIEKYSKSLFELDSLYKNLNLSLLQKEFSYE